MKRRAVFIYGCCALMWAQLMGPDSPYWSITVTGLQVIWVGAGAYQFVQGMKANRAELESQRNREIRSQRIRELEKELGYEPLELAVDDAPEIWPKGGRE